MMKYKYTSLDEILEKAMKFYNELVESKYGKSKKSSSKAGRNASGRTKVTKKRTKTKRPANKAT